MIPSNSIIEKYNQNLPRYTSYPPANFFNEFSTSSYIKALQDSNNQNPSNISIYIHIPFCEQLCWYCGCNTIICNSNSQIHEYISLLKKEMNCIFELLDSTRIVTQIHFGGGSPNSLSIEQLESIIDVIRNKFTLHTKAEIAIECNPADIDLLYIEGLSKIGFTRISLGIQDFNSNVLDAVHRKVPKIPISLFTQKIHECKMEVNFDFIYGLPLQTPLSYRKTIEEAIALSPERIVTFSYAHVPGVKTHQKILEKYIFPTANEKIEMLTNAYLDLTQADYIAIGLDHFAKTKDSLSLALQEKTLHRNFQGYCTRETTGQVYAFGVSAITQLHNAFIQNTKDLDEYKINITNQGFAPKLGYNLSHEEILTGAVIEFILCNQSLDWKIVSNFLQYKQEDLQQMFKWNTNQLNTFIEDNLIINTPNGFEITEIGKYFLRNIASAFDSKLVNSKKTFSKTI